MLQEFCNFSKQMGLQISDKQCQNIVQTVNDETEYYKECISIAQIISFNNKLQKVVEKSFTSMKEKFEV